MFNPPASPTNGSEYTYGNVVWQYQNPPGVWNIKNGTLVGTDGVGVSGFRLIGTDLYFHYVYPGGVTSSEINLGTVVGAGSIDSGITFSFPYNNSSDRVVLGETVQISATGSIRAFSGGNNVISIDNRLATVTLTGVAYYENADFNVLGDGKVLFDPSRIFLRVGLGSQTKNNITMQTHAASSTLTLNPGSGLTASWTRGAGDIDHTLYISGITATNTQIGIASFKAGDFTVTSGQVSLTAGIVNSVNGRTGSVALPLANTSGTTGIASFRAGDFTVSAAGEVGLTGTLVNSLYVDSKTLTGYIAISSANGAGLRPVRITSTKASPNSSASPDNIYINVLDASTNENLPTSATAGVAFYDKNDFVLTSPLGGAYGVMVSLTASAFVRQINGATGNLLVGAGDDKIVFTNPTGLSANPNFLFDGNTLTFGGPNTSMMITGPTFAFGDLTQVKGGVYTQFSESATAFNYSGANADIIIDPRDGTIQKIKRTGLTQNIRVKLASSGWSTVPNTVQSVVVYLQQSGSSHTGEFDSSIIADRRVPMFGVTGGIDVFTISRYAVTNSTGLTMGFSVAVGLTGAGIAF